MIPGVVDAAVGYSNGHTENPTYKDVCSDETGHAEVVQVTFDPAEVSYETLVDAFWHMHDPTQMNRQGPDFGKQYRSAIFTHSPAQEATAHKSKAALEASKKFHRPIATEITPAGTFYRAEEYHQRYLEKRGMNSIAAYCIAHFLEGSLQSSLRIHLGANSFGFAGSGLQPFWEGATILLCYWLILLWMYQRKLFLKI